MPAWQDLERTIPAALDGDPIAVWEEGGVRLAQPSLQRMPYLRDGRPVFDNVDDALSLAPDHPPLDKCQRDLLHWWMGEWNL